MERNGEIFSVYHHCSMSFFLFENYKETAVATHAQTLLFCYVTLELESTLSTSLL